MIKESSGPESSGIVDVPVDGLDVAVYTIPTDQPEADGTITWSATTMVAVHARAGAQTGLGWTYAAGAAAGVVREILAGVVRGRDALDVPAAWSAMQRQLRNVGRPGIASCALSAVDVALWDLAARLTGLPLVRLLGRARDDVPVYGSGGFTSYDDDTLRRQLRGWVERQDIPRVKIKVGESWGACEARDLARAGLARLTIGDDAELFVDANGGYTVGQAVRMGRRYDDLGVTWFEEPVSSDDLDGLRQVRGELACDVAAGEYLGRSRTPAAWSRPTRSTACRPTRPGAAGTRSGCGSRPSPPLATCRCRRTARPRCTRPWPPPRPTCGTSSGSTTTCASSTSCSTARRHRRAAPCTPTSRCRDTA